MLIILPAMLYQVLFPWLEHLRKELLETAGWSVAELVLRLNQRRRTSGPLDHKWRYCNCRVRPKNHWIKCLSMARRNDPQFLSWTGEHELLTQGGRALTKWRGTTLLPGVRPSFPSVAKVSLNSEHSHLDSSAPMEPMLENWPTTGQDSALGMDEACSFRSCERTQWTLQSLTRERKCCNGSAHGFPPLDFLINEKCWKH